MHHTAEQPDQGLSDIALRIRDLAARSEVIRTQTQTTFDEPRIREPRIRASRAKDGAFMEPAGAIARNQRQMRPQAKWP